MRASTRTVALLALATACDRPEPRFEHLDRPSPTPQELDLQHAEPASLDEPPEEDETDRCTRGTGRNAEGRCERLRTRDAGYVERVALPAGAFVMGDVPRGYDATPARQDVRLLWPGQPPRRAEVQAFWIDLHEVTRQAYEACVTAGTCSPARCPDGEDPAERYPTETPEVLPQTCVTPEQARVFCAAHGGRLPTEAEWEYAARGADARIYPWGNQIADELLKGIGPVTSPVVDISYFGLRGMGVNAIEWVAEAYDPDAPLASFVTRDFRSPKGPLRRTVSKSSRMHVAKGGRAGARLGIEGIDGHVGFRCAADLAADEIPLTIPVDAPEVPAVRQAGDTWVFGGVAEVVSHAEAKAFCSAVRIEHDGRTFDAWRLPTLDEVQAVTELFRGPGPFWAAQGAVVQQTLPGARGKPTDPWVEESAEPDEPLAARCIHD